MSDREGLPSYFSSKAPLDEKVDLLPLNASKKQFYWKLSVQNVFRRSEQISSGRTTLAPYEDNETDLLDCCDLEDNYEINPTKSGKYLTAFYVPPLLLSVIVGPGGSKLRQLQDTTGTLIKVPKPHEAPVVKVTGHSERSVASARTQISLLLLARREKLSVTHFVSIPVISREIRDNFCKFKDGILEGPPTRGVDGSIFQKSEKFHLTIATLTLLDDKEIEEAKSLFKQCQDSVSKIFRGRKPEIRLQGVEIMNDDPSEVDVLYGKISVGAGEDGVKFQQLADEVLDVFCRNGFVSRKHYEGVKLHVTLMNSLFRKTDEYQKVDKKVSSSLRESFDATWILDKFGDFYFGRLVFEEIDLSIRFTSDKNGYYEAAAVISL